MPSRTWLVLPWLVAIGCSGSKSDRPESGAAVGAESGLFPGPDSGSAAGPDNGFASTCTKQTGGCDPLGITGPSIALSQGSSPIAAIETSGDCGITWSTAYMAAYRFEKAPATACSSGPPCLHYDCIPQNDGGLGCKGAYIHTLVSCSVTVTSITGESQSFEVTARKPDYPNYCWTGTGQCVNNTQMSVWPVTVTLSFTSPDSSADPDALVDPAD